MEQLINPVEKGAITAAGIFGGILAFVIVFAIVYGTYCLREWIASTLRKKSREVDVSAPETEDRKEIAIVVIESEPAANINS